MAKKQGQIYIRDFKDSFYVGQTADTSADNQYNRAAAHAAAACRIDIYKGKSVAGGARWKKAERMNSLYPEDAKIREVGLSKTTYHTYDNLNVFQPLVAAFHEAGFYSSRDQEAVNTAEYDTLDIAEISLIYHYLAAGHKLLNKDQGGQAGLKFHPEKTNWGRKLQSLLRVEGFNYTPSGGVNLGKNTVGKHKTNDAPISSANNSLYNLLNNNNNRPSAIEVQILDYIKAVIYQYVQQKVADAYALSYSGANGINIGINVDDLTEELNNQLQQLDIAKIINNSGDNLKFNGQIISRQIKNLQTHEPQNLVQAIVKKYYNGKHVWRRGDTFKKDLIKFLREKGHKAQISYDFDIDLHGGSFVWEPQRIVNQINAIVSSNEAITNSDRMKYMMVYGICFAICHYIYTHILDVYGPVLTVDGQEIAVRHGTQSEIGITYSDFLRAKVIGWMPNWITNNDATWNGYYDAAMALYHSMTHSSQMRMSNRDQSKSITNRYYFSNLDLNGGFNTNDFVGLSSFEHKQSKKEGWASAYGGNYYYKVNSGSIFQKIDDKNRLGVEYIQQVYNDLYNLS